MWSEFICFFGGMLFGIIVILSIYLFCSRKESKMAEDIISDHYAWCEENCKHYEWCFSFHEDPDDALKALDKFCANCPICEAEMIIYKNKYTK